MRLVIALAVLANVGCSASGPVDGGVRDSAVDADMDAGIEQACTDERRLSCSSGWPAPRGVVCCDTHEVAFDGGPCTPPRDGGTDTGDPCANPAVQSGGCPCDPDAGTTNCDDRGVVLECRGGIWQLTSYTCAPLCPMP